MSSKIWIGILAIFLSAASVGSAVLWTQASRYRTQNRHLTAKLGESTAQVFFLEEHIRKNLRMTSLSESELLKHLPFESTVLPDQDSIWLLLLPRGTCEACANAVFATVDAAHNRPTSILLISEVPQPALQREWKSRGFETMSLDNDALFRQLKLHTDMLILKLYPTSHRPMQYLLCEPVSIKFLPVFLES